MVAKKVTKTQKGGEDNAVTVTEVPVDGVSADKVPAVPVADESADVPAAKGLEPDVLGETGQEGGEQKGGSKKRTFKIKLADAEFCSRITGSTPKQAASKALTLLINQKKKAGKAQKGKLVFTIKETTRGSKGKEYSYQGEKVKLKTPTTYSIKSSNGEIKTIVNKFKNVIEKHQQTA